MKKLSQDQQQELFQKMLTDHRAAAQQMSEVELRLHVAMHVVVEIQLREGQPPIMRATKERLVKEGLSEHEALHALGSVAASEVQDVFTAQRQYKEADYIARLHALSAEKWRAQQEEIEGLKN